MSTWYRLHKRVVLFLMMVLLPTGVVAAEPCLLAYPLAYTVFQYNSALYDAISSSHPDYDPSYGVAGQMLWNLEAGRVAAEVYRAPGLYGFEPSSSGYNEFFTAGNTTTIRVDGFSEMPRQLNDIYVEFRPYPLNSTPDIFVDGERIEGLRYFIPRLVVSTPTADGFYSDSVDLGLRWVGAQMMTIIVFADKNGNRVFDGEPGFIIVMEDLTVPTENRTWGSIKLKYKND
jgi:hypothetical protein